MHQSCRCPRCAHQSSRAWNHSHQIHTHLWDSDSDDEKYFVSWLNFKVHLFIKELSWALNLLIFKSFKRVS